MSNSTFTPSAELQTLIDEKKDLLEALKELLIQKTK
jgi:hypothetical protein